MMEMVGNIPVHVLDYIFNVANIIPQNQLIVSIKAKMFV